ncbi:MAG: transporter [Lysobacter sp.]|nr:transporter [Lysobacter sp.]
MRQALLCLVLGAFAAPAGAEEPMSTDRPDVANSSDTVGAGRWQLETGVAWARQRADGTTTATWTTPVLLRIGTGERWELRIGSDGWQRATVHGNGVHDESSGLADLDVGFKYHWQATGPAGASLGWLVDAKLPTGARAVRGHGVRPGVMLAAEWELPQGNGLSVMPGIVYDSDDAGRRYASGVLAVSLDHPWTPRAHGFVEVAAEQLAARAHGGNVATFDTGATWRVDNDTQVDVAASVGLTAAAPGRALTIGWSRRW